ncbi:MAG: NUDIX hydrolase [Clostridia bacterium]|nr:NUDIX hydrolase [Clostridia bacterium]
MQSDKELKEVCTASAEIFDGVVLHLYRDEIRLPNGQSGVREVVRHVGAVCILPLFADGGVLVERQFRYPHDSVLLEIPAGKLNDKREDHLAAAQRELDEETGYFAKTWTSLGIFYPAPAYADEQIEMYLAEDLCPDARGRHLDEDEFLTVEKIHIDRLCEMVMRGEIPDAKTQLAILKVKRLLDERKRQLSREADG